MNATWTHRDYGFVIGLLTAVCGSRPGDLARPTIGRFASECSIRQGILATARPNSISTLALVSVRRSTSSSGEPKAAETTLPTRWHVRPTLWSDSPRAPAAVVLEQAGRIPVQTAGLRHFAHCRDAPWNRPSRLRGAVPCQPSGSRESSHRRHQHLPFFERSICSPLFSIAQRARHAAGPHSR